MERNPSYSLRAFARDIELSPSRLSEVISGKHGISRSTARAICRSIGLAQGKVEYWCDVVDANFARCERQRDHAQRRLKKAKSQPDVYEFSGDEFALIADWYHLAALELMKLDAFVPQVTWVASKLKISEETAVEAIDRLERLGMISIDDSGEWHLVRGRSSVGDRLIPDAMRTFHAQILEKATASLVSHPRNERYLQALVSAISEQGFRELTEAMREFQSRVVDIALKYQGKDRVIGFSMQAFPLSEVAKRSKEDADVQAH